jgi:hypothetical protein
MVYVERFFCLKNVLKNKKWWGWDHWDKNAADNGQDEMLSCWILFCAATAPAGSPDHVLISIGINVPLVECQLICHSAITEPHVPAIC